MRRRRAGSSASRWTGHHWSHTTKRLAVPKHRNRIDLIRIYPVLEAALRIRTASQALDKDLFAGPAEDSGVEQVFFGREADVLRRITQSIVFIECAVLLQLRRTFAGDHPRSGFINRLAVDLQPLA